MALTGCATASIVSVKSPAYQGTPRSLLIIAALGPTFQSHTLAQQPPDDSQTRFKRKISAVLRACGISPEIEIVDGVATPAKSDGSAQSSTPDAILRIQAVWATSRGMTAFHLDMTSGTGAAVLWQADMSFHAGGSESDNGNVLAKTFIGQMVQDEILPQSCVFL